MDTNNLGQALKGRRKAKKLTLKQVAELSGVHSSHIGRIETGNRFPSGRILRRLAEPLGFTEVEILKLAGFMSRDDNDARVDRLKLAIKEETANELISLHQEIADVLVSIYRKIDGL